MEKRRPKSKLWGIPVLEEYAEDKGPLEESEISHQ